MYVEDQPIKINVVGWKGGGGTNTYEVPLDFRMGGGVYIYTPPYPLLQRPYQYILPMYVGACSTVQSAQSKVHSACSTVAAAKYWTRVPHDAYGVCHLMLISNLDFIHIRYHYNLSLSKYIIIRFVVVIYIYQYYGFTLKTLHIFILLF